ncbi:DUF2059 domain-containing protein [Salidesulfovibrio onnuriiensis]|uniref:DUF2059 domain-containing protein n=1 Tax=Salidesulfovibrio onnuriiensis TaxID=2583823 RepID=UPI0016501506|nr:DUF2059 domain-containing protein [Salidesulfovibrio onnuriiensis]
MKKLTLCLLILVVPVFCFAGDTDADRLEAARRYADVSNFSRMMRDMTDSAIQIMPEKEGKAFRKFMHSLQQDDSMEKMVVVLMAKHFSTHELNALSDFYGSDTGRHVLEKLGPYMAELNVVMQHYIIQALREFESKLRSGEIPM